MTFEEFMSLAKLIKEYISALIWPGLIFWIVFRFSKELAKFFDGMSELSFKAGGVEATAKTKQIEAAVALSAAYAKSPSSDNSMKPMSKISSRIAEIVENNVTYKNIKRLNQTQILWVDDNPNNNIHERKAFEALGMKFTLSKSTEEALQELGNEYFDVVISDMGRPPDAQAGYTLLKEMRDHGNTTPFIIYAGSKAPQHREEAKTRGAQGCTNDPNELFELVLSHLETKLRKNR